MKAIWKNIKLLFEIFSLSHKFDPQITMFEFLHGLCLNLERIINVVMPAWIVNLIFQKKPWRIIIFSAVFYGVFRGLLGCGERCFKLLQEAHGFRACNLLRMSMNSKYMRMNYADTENSVVTDSFEKAKDSMWEFADVGYVIFDDIIGNLIAFACMSYILFEVNLYVYAAVLVLVGINLRVQYYINKKSHESQIEEQVQKKWCDYLSGLMQNPQIGKEIRLFHSQKFMEQKYENYADQYKAQVRKRERTISRYSMAQSIIYFAQLIIVYFSAIQNFMKGIIPVGSFLMYISSINQLTESIRNILTAGIELFKVSYYYKDYTDFMGIEETMDRPGGFHISPEEVDILEFSDVTFYYPESRTPAVDHVSFSLRKNEVLGLVGENGSGKSTLIKLILRLYDPSEGKILLNGRDIRSYNYREYLGVMKAVFQDFSIFAYSILENIVFDSAVDKKRLQQALHMTELDKRIKKYEKGIDSMVTKVLDDEGIQLSGGERQLVAITRTLYHPSKIVIYDEPTAALDPLKEAYIFEMIHRALSGKTAVFCAHRMSSTKFCDMILVIENGKVIERGSHKELMTRKGKYYQMFMYQAHIYDGRYREESLQE